MMSLGGEPGGAVQEKRRWLNRAVYLVGKLCAVALGCAWSVTRIDSKRLLSQSGTLV